MTTDKTLRINGIVRQVVASVLVLAIGGAWGFVLTRASADDVKTLDNRLDKHEVTQATTDNELKHIQAEQQRQGKLLENIHRAIVPAQPLPPPVPSHVHEGG